MGNKKGNKPGRIAMGKEATTTDLSWKGCAICTQKYSKNSRTHVITSILLVWNPLTKAYYWVN